MSDQTYFLRRPYLEIIWPDGKSEKFHIKSERTSCGRQTSDNQIIVPKSFSSVSRKHFEIIQKGADFKVVDLNSTNGVYLNGERIHESANLHDGDTITIGKMDKAEEIKVIFHYEAGGLIEQAVVTPQEIDIPLSMTVYSEPPLDKPYLKFRWLTGSDSYLCIEKDILLFGRDEEADIQFPGRMVFTSGKHFEIRRKPEGYAIVDLESTNGTLLNGIKLIPNTPARLHNGDVIRIGDEVFGASLGINFVDPRESSPLEGFSFAAQVETKEVKKTAFIIGRQKNCSLVIDSPNVSRRHALFEAKNGSFWITDLDSLNGTYLNGQRITKAEVQEGDQIGIGSHIFTLIDEQLIRYDSFGMRVDVLNLTKDIRTRHGPLRILDDISMSILPREFIAIVGGSGAGKTTLMNALIGSNPADGQVNLNGQDFYKEYDQFRDQIGYVPQTDILHTALTVEKALDYAALLRLPPDTSPNERERRITEVLETVSMNTETIRSTRIKNLSGGQRKRISIAAELLADPKLLYLDEPTSGLDPGLEKKMMHTLRHMADQGRTVVLITHATVNILQVDHVAFISQGRLVYFGPPQEALDFFEVEEFADIYERIERHGEEWREIFTKKKPQLYQRYVLDRQEPEKLKPIIESAKKIKFGLGKFFRQLGVLTRRSLNIQAMDFVTLGLLAALYPFTALLQLLISSPDVLIGDPGIMADPIAAAKTLLESYAPLADTRIFVFITGLEAVLIGMYVPSNELILERSVYLRERMVNLKILPYLLSKVLVFSLFAFVQCVLYLLVLSIGVDFPEQGLYFPAPIEMFITVFIAMVATIGIGLFVSSLAKSPEMAMYMLVMMLFFQFFFAGIIFDLRDKPAEPLSYFTTTRWSMIALGVTTDLENVAESTIICNTMEDNPQTPELGDEITSCIHYPEATEELLLSYEDDNLLISWGVMAAMGLVFLVLTGISIKRLDKT
jgi:ABC-type multidrug transport system ATPase subunit/pSer/pThr/pTyr-binding forkhead associated (FHA) protein